MSIVDTIPPGWKPVIKQNQHSALQTLNGIIFVKVIRIDVSSKLLYKEFKFPKSTPLQLPKRNKINIPS